MNRRAGWMLLVPAIFALSGCAASTMGSGVSDKIMQRPPFYAGLLRSDSARVGHFPIVYQRGASQSPIFDPKEGSGTPVTRLLADMNAFLDSLGLTTRIDSLPDRTSKVPDVEFSCDAPFTGADCDESSRGKMRLAVTKPSAEWTSSAVSAATSVRADRMLLLTLEIGEYWPRQKNILGGKELELGSGHVMGLPWHTSLDDPINVLQITGALMGADGRAIRIGAEGMTARRSNLLVSAAGGQTLITDEDVEKLRTSKRTDLPGEPLVWQVALRELVRGLLGAPFTY